MYTSLKSLLFTIASLSLSSALLADHCPRIVVRPHKENCCKPKENPCKPKEDSRKHKEKPRKHKKDSRKHKEMRLNKPCGCDQLLFKANLSQCDIGLGTSTMQEMSTDDEDDVNFASPATFETGADFVVAFGGNDFSCRKIKHCGIEIRPANGSSFTLSVPPVPNPGPVPGGLFDHVKFLAYSLFRLAPTNGCELCTTWVGSGSQLQVDNNPFGAAVSDPHSDPRLACAAFVSLDPNTLTTFDWMITDKVIYTFVERLPLLNTTYASYTYLIPVAKREHRSDPLKDIHTFKTCYNKKKGTMKWILDGQKVFKINQIGFRLTENNAFVYHNGKKRPLKHPKRFQVAEHGGTNELVSPDGIQTGLALFTLLDFYPPQTSLHVNKKEIVNSGFYEGLVRLESNLFRFDSSFFYNNPLEGGEASFTQDSFLVGTQYQPTIPSIFRIFGQGAALRLYDYTISLENSEKLTEKK